jgi:hypothetical protein
VRNGQIPGIANVSGEQSLLTHCKPCPRAGLSGPYIILGEVEKGYIASTLEFCTDVLKKSTDDFQKSFADIVSFAPGTFDWDVLKQRP